MMNIAQYEVDGIKVLSLDGRMDATSVTDFDQQWKALLDAGVNQFVVNFEKLEYISSAGLRGVLMLAKTARVKKATIIFAGMQRMVSDMFKISGFSAILSTAPTLSDGIAQLKK